MHYKEFDSRSALLRTFCTTSTNAIAELMEFSSGEILDGITAMEYAEYLLGATLVACQKYALGTVSDFNEIKCSNETKLELYKYQEKRCLEHTHVELINALTNLFKHHEEWSSWPKNETTKVLRYFGINENTEFPLRTGITVIIGESPDLRWLAAVLEDWRFSLFNVRRANA